MDKQYEKLRESSALAEISRRVRQEAAAAQASAAMPAAPLAAQAVGPRDHQFEENAAISTPAGAKKMKKEKRKRNSVASKPSQDEKAAHHGGSAAAGGEVQMLQSLETDAAEPEAADDSLTFREVYLDTFMSAFADDLETFRANDTGRSAVRTELVLQCIEAGMDTFSEAERASWLEDARLVRQAVSLGQPGAAAAMAAAPVAVAGIAATAWL